MTGALGRWVVHKATREPGPVSYAGAAWAGVKLRYEERYADHAYACRVAEALSGMSRDGFTVSPCEEVTPPQSEPVPETRHRSRRQR